MKLVFAVDVIRHADRTSIHHIPGFSENWRKEDMGKLTKIGEQNAVSLGEKLKKYYVDTHFLLPDSFQSDSIFIRSSNFQRTQKTAICIMKGMYGLQFEDIPIHVVPKQEDLLLLGFLYAPGKEMQAITREHRYSLKLSEEVTQEIDCALKEINSKFNTNFKDIGDIAKIADIIKTSNKHETSLSKKISDKERANIFQLTQLLYRDIFTSPGVACAGAGALVKKILEKIHSKVTGKTSLKYMLFSGHDVNILSMVSLLDLPLKEAPYLSNVKFELFKQDSSSFFIKVSCMGEHAQIHPEEYCPFDQFELLIADKLKIKYAAMAQLS